MSVTDQLRERKSRQFALLLALYERRGNERLDPIALGAGYGIDRVEAERATRYADEEGLVKRLPGDGAMVTLAPAGIALVEAALATPNQGSSHFPPVASLNLPADLRARVPGAASANPVAARAGLKIAR
jgi:hypothetical protein